MEMSRSLHPRQRQRSILLKPLVRDPSADVVFSQYHESCTESDAARLKLDKLPAGDRHEDRYRKSHRRSVADMRNAKNDYLLSIKVANEAKKRFYVVDMPGITGELRECGYVGWRDVC